MNCDIPDERCYPCIVLHAFRRFFEFHEDRKLGKLQQIFERTFSPSLLILLILFSSHAWMALTDDNSGPASQIPKLSQFVILSMKRITRMEGYTNILPNTEIIIREKLKLANISLLVVI